MKKEFNIEQEVGKRMPYSTPDGFFDQLEDNIMAQLKEEQEQQKQESKRPAVMRVLRSNWKSIISLSVAACAAVLLVMKHNVPEQEAQQPYGFNNVELAYSNLSTEDQQFLIEIYSESEDEELFNYEEN